MRGCVALLVLLVMLVMRDAEVGGARAAGGAGRMHFLLRAGGGLDEWRGGAGRRLGQTGAQRTLQLRDVISVLEEDGSNTVAFRDQDSRFCRYRWK